MTQDRILALDVGTSGVKAVVTDLDGRIVDRASRPYGLRTAASGWVDQDLDEILEGSRHAIRSLVSRMGRGPQAFAVVSVTAQMFNLVAVDRDGRTVLPMLSWLDQRSEPDARRLAQRMDTEEQYRTLGAVVTGKDILPKILWLRDQRPDLYRASVMLLDCKEAMVLHLTGRAVIDHAGASAFRLFDRASLRWNEVACREIGVALEMLPDVAPSTSIAGGITASVALETGLIAGTPVVVGAGDVPASQVGTGAVRVGDAHASLGTAAYLGITVAEPLVDPGRRLGVIGHMQPRGWILWLEVATGGGALAWATRFISGLTTEDGIDYREVDRLVVDAADDMEDLLFAPWLSGERVPVFDDRIRAAFIGLALHHGRGHMLRAVMEGVAYQMRWALEYGLAFGQPVADIRAVGGGAIGSVWIQIIADILGRPIHVIRDPEDAAAVGAAACGIVALGLRSNFEFARALATVDHVHVPDSASRLAYEDRYRRFRRLYDALASVPMTDA